MKKCFALRLLFLFLLVTPRKGNAPNGAPSFPPSLGLEPSLVYLPDFFVFLPFSSVFYTLTRGKECSSFLTVVPSPHETQALPPLFPPLRALAVDSPSLTASECHERTPGPFHTPSPCPTWGISCKKVGGREGRRKGE